MPQKRCRTSARARSMMLSIIMCWVPVQHGARWRHAALPVSRSAALVCLVQAHMYRCVLVDAHCATKASEYRTDNGNTTAGPGWCALALFKCPLLVRLLLQLGKLLAMVAGGALAASSRTAHSMHE
jgi:hypothetical protein